jgi:hypothetical protein
MYIPFQELSDQASVWIYQADRQLNATEEQVIVEQTKKFLESWSSHGRPLQASMEIRHGYFLILGIEKTDFKLTCCTTDSSIQLLHILKASMNINFLDRSKVILKTDDKFSIVPLRKAKEKLQGEILPGDVFTFNNTITQKQDLEARWVIPIRDAWFAK